MRVRAYSLGVIAFILCVSSAVTLTIVLSPLLYRMLLWGVPRVMRETDLTLGELMHNYRTLYVYLLTPWQVRLQFPNFISSPQGLQHFAEVKQLMWMNVALMSALALYLRGIVWQTFRQLGNWLRIVWRQIMIGMVCLIPVVIMAFRPLFLLFHRLAFRNDYWIFDPRLDPVILALPTELFLLCACAILMISAVLLLWLMRVVMR